MIARQTGSNSNFRGRGRGQFTMPTTFVMSNDLPKRRSLVVEEVWAAIMFGFCCWAAWSNADGLGKNWDGRKFQYHTATTAEFEKPWLGIKRLEFRLRPQSRRHGRVLLLSKFNEHRKNWRSLSWIAYWKKLHTKTWLEVMSDWTNRNSMAHYPSRKSASILAVGAGSSGSRSDYGPLYNGQLLWWNENYDPPSFGIYTDYTQWLLWVPMS